MQKDTRQDFKRGPTPVLRNEQFHSLCRQPPLQTAMLGVAKMGKPTFWPLLPSEGPAAGLVLGLDAEFVAFSPPSKALRGCALPLIPSHQEELGTLLSAGRYRSMGREIEFSP